MNSKFLKWTASNEPIENLMKMDPMKSGMGIIALAVSILFFYNWHTTDEKEESSYSRQGHDILSKKDRMRMSAIKVDNKLNIQQQDQELGVRLENMMSNKIGFPMKNDKRWESFVDDLIQFSSVDPAGALRILEAAVIGQSREDILALHMYFCQGLASNDPLKAIDWAHSLSDASIADACLKSAFSIWIQRKDQDTISILNSLAIYKDKDWSRTYILNSISRLASQDIQSADNWIFQNLSTYPNLFYAGISSLFVQAGKKSPEDLTRLINTCDLGDRRGEVIAGVISSLSTKDFNAAFEFVQQSVGKGFEKDALNGLVAQSFQQSPDEIAKLAATISPGESAPIISNGLSKWILNDYVEANKWISRQSKEFQMSMSALGIPQTLATKSPDLAIEFVNGVSLEPEVRTSQYKSIVDVWGLSDPSKAIQWISGLSSNLQSELMPNFVSALGGENGKLAYSFIISSNLADEGKAAALRRLDELNK